MGITCDQLKAVEIGKGNGKGKVEFIEIYL